jgi:L-amino acid N-acyltransferase YncA
MENSYTFKKYRGKKLYPSALVELAEIARDKGFKRILTYVREDNLASIKGCERAGFQVFGRVTEVKLLFSTKRKYPYQSNQQEGA